VFDLNIFFLLLANKGLRKRISAIQTEGHHSVDTLSENRRIVKSKTGVEGSSIVQKLSHVHSHLVVGVLDHQVTDLLNKRMGGVDFQHALGGHERIQTSAQGLSTLDALHVGTVRVSSRDESTRGGGQTLGQHNLVHLRLKVALAEVHKGLEVLLLVGVLLSIITQVQIDVLSDVDHLVGVEGV